MSCATGESVLKDDIKIQSDLVDMEAYVYAKFSQKFNIDFHDRILEITAKSSSHLINAGVFIRLTIFGLILEILICNP